MHDIGLLHLDPNIVCNNRKLEANEWRTIQAHVVVGKIIADSIPGISTEIPRAILEHHENCFGAGYPFALTEDQLGIPGRIISMTDSIHSIRVKSFGNTQRTLGDIKPYLQLNPTTNSYDVYRATISIIKKSGLQPLRQIPEYCSEHYAKSLGKQIDILGEAQELLDDIYQNIVELSSRTDVKPLPALAAITRRIRSSIQESGLLSNDIAEWLKKERDISDMTDDVIGEFNEIELLLKELTWQIRNTARMFHSYDNPNATDNTMVVEHIKVSVESLQGIFDRLSEVGI
jgi:hypothetical protein